jgi:hypothetical protein
MVPTFAAFRAASLAGLVGSLRKSVLLGVETAYRKSELVASRSNATNCMVAPRYFRPTSAAASTSCSYRSFSHRPTADRTSASIGSFV